MQQPIFKHFYIFLVCTLFTFEGFSQQIGNIAFNKNWQFSLGEISAAIQPEFNDSNWQTVNVPHDWSINGPFSKENPSFSRGGWLPTGKCTYRKTFTVTANKADEKVFIYFDGAYRNSVVYINGHKVGFRPLGYISFEYDLTNHINFNGKNVLTVTLDNSEQPGHRWYSGTGIYRDVTLKIRNKTYIPNWSLYVTTPTISTKSATVNTAFDIKTEFDKPSKITAKTSILKNNIEVASAKKEIIVTATKTLQLNEVLTINNPLLWSPEHPELYTVKIQLFKGKKLIGEETTKTGIRELTFNKDTGFSINGVQTKLKGVCLHHDGGPLGAAVYKRTIERQLEILKEMGCNAVRTAHNPFSTEFLETCDEMGSCKRPNDRSRWKKSENSC